MIRETWNSFKGWVEDIYLLSTVNDWVRRLIVVILLIGLAIAARIIWTVVDINYQVVNVDTGECTSLAVPASTTAHRWSCLNCSKSIDSKYISYYVFQNLQSGELRKFSKDKHLVLTRLTKDDRCHQ